MSQTQYAWTTEMKTFGHYTEIMMNVAETGIN